MRNGSNFHLKCYKFEHYLLFKLVQSSCDIWNVFTIASPHLYVISNQVAAPGSMSLSCQVPILARSCATLLGRRDNSYFQMLSSPRTWRRTAKWKFHELSSIYEHRAMGCVKSSLHDICSTFIFQDLKPIQSWRYWPGCWQLQCLAFPWFFLQMDDCSWFSSHLEYQFTSCVTEDHRWLSGTF